jgi:hypothetical protein
LLGGGRRKARAGLGQESIQGMPGISGDTVVEEFLDDPVVGPVGQVSQEPFAGRLLQQPKFAAAGSCFVAKVANSNLMTSGRFRLGSQPPAKEVGRGNLINCSSSRIKAGAELGTWGWPELRRRASRFERRRFFSWSRFDMTALHVAGEDMNSGR